MMNMQFWMGQLERTIRRKEWKQAGEICARMINDVKIEQQKPSIIFTLTKQQALQNIRASLERLVTSTMAQSSAQASSAQANVNAAFAYVAQAFEFLYSNTLVYMLRHPEKTSEKGRVLSQAGVKQAHDYALLLINEILLCPKNVRVVMYTSEIERTKKFAQLVAYALNKLSQMQERTVNVIMGGEDPALFFRFSKQELDFVSNAAEQKGIPGDGGFANCMDWATNASIYAQTISTMPNPARIVVELHDFASRSLSRFPTSQGELTIVLGFTHSWILDVFRIQYAGSNVKAIIPSAGFVKIDDGQIFIDTNWYPYK